MIQQYLVLSWMDIEEAIDQLSKKIPFKPQIIAGISRGGLVPARLLADKMDVSWVMSFEELQGKFQKENLWRHLPDDSEILIVDDVSDSGKTLERIHLHYPLWKTATIHYKPHTIRRATYDMGIVQNDVWIVYPWEKWEHKRKLVVPYTVNKRGYL